jgi:hypothetical protein
MKEEEEKGKLESALNFLSTHIHEAQSRALR